MDSVLWERIRKSKDRCVA